MLDCAALLLYFLLVRDFSLSALLHEKSRLRLDFKRLIGLASRRSQEFS